ncbi:MAG: hypothetical protein KDB03_01575 [Planctomycetales bacterium]|nr:hypothetical protein [Planctomycetales bacterium]
MANRLSDNATVSVAAARNLSIQFRRDPPLTFNRLCTPVMGVIVMACKSHVRDWKLLELL